MRLAFVVVATLASTMMTTPAHADDAGDAAQARKEFDEGSKAYDLGDFSEAAHRYEAAYKLKPDPALLFNIGQAYRFAGDKPAALRAYRGFIRRAPDSPNRGEVEAQIASLQQQIDDEKKNAKPEPAPTPSAPPPVPTPTPATTTPTTPSPTLTAAPIVHPRPPIYKRAWFWATIAGVAAVGAGVALAVAFTTPKDAPAQAGTVTLVFP